MLTVRSVADLNRTIAKNLHRIDRSAFDVVVGIPRSGMIPASIIATALQKPLSDVESYSRGYIFERSGRVASALPRVLLVDDTSNRGGAMARAVERIGGRASSIIRMAVYGPYRDDFSIIDIFLEECPGPRAFQWNMWKHMRLNRWGVDFDGVLCRDPERDENDDGPRYLDFLRSAEPLFLPTKPVGHIITCRLEKYRSVSQAWLRHHGVEFGELHMMPYATKAERMAAGNRGGWKAKQVRRLGVEFFIESSEKQAAIVTREAGIPVWCTATQSLA